MKKKEDRCPTYVGVNCVGGYCPKALQEGKTVKCEDCFYYNGCEDCALRGTEYCTES